MQGGAKAVKNIFDHLPTLSKEPRFVSSVLSHTFISPDVSILTIKRPPHFSFIAGQYAWIILPKLSKKHGKIDRRAYSFYSGEQEDSLEFLIRFTESPFLKEVKKIKKGHTIELIGPMGNTFILPETGGVVLAGGTGIAPFVSALKSEKGKGSDFFFFANNKRPIHDKQLLKRLANNAGNRIEFLKNTLVSKHLKKIVSKNDSRPIYISGPQGFVDTMTRKCQSSLGSVTKCRYEACYPSAKKQGYVNNLFQTMEAGSKKPDSHKEITLPHLFFESIKHMTSHIIFTDVHGTILYANKTAEETTGYTFEEMKGQTPRLWGGLMTDSYYTQLWHKLQSKYASHKIPLLLNRKKDGTLYTTVPKIIPLLHQNTIIAYAALEENIEQIREQTQKILFANAKIEAMLESIGDGIVAMDKDGKIMYMNDVAKAHFRLKKITLGKSFDKTWQMETEQGHVLTDDERPIRRALLSGKRIHTREYYYIRMDKTRFPVDITTTPIKLPDEKVVGSITIFRDITKEKEIDKEKTEFVSLASHQLRTPLSGMNWYIELMQSGSVGDLTEKQKECFEQMANASKRLTELVSSLLNVSRLELGTFTIEPESVNLIDMTTSILSELDPLIQQKKIRIAKHLSKKIPNLKTDKKMMRMVIENILTNAIKYTPSAGHVSIALETKNQQIQITIKDTGIGIPKNDQDKIFSKLYRAENAMSAVTDGTGLGLYMVKQILEQMNGDISFQSSEGKGTSFFVIIPLDKIKKRKGTSNLT